MNNVKKESQRKNIPTFLLKDTMLLSIHVKYQICFIEYIENRFS